MEPVTAFFFVQGLIWKAYISARFQDGWIQVY